MMQFRYITFSCSMALLLAVTANLAAADTMGPGEVVVQTIDKGIKILEGPEYQGSEMLQARKDKLWETLTPVFNFEETAKRSLGYHWKDRTKPERNEFIDVFTQVLKDIYLGKTDQYSGGEFEYVREIVKGSRGKVRTTFTTSEQKKVTVDFSMKNASNEWKVYDIIIEGVSMVGNYRSQFNTILSKSTFEELMVKLRDKRDEFDLERDSEK